MPSDKETSGADFTPEEIQELERERAERLDPNNRPANAEIDNTTREWVSEKEDFRDNLEGHPPEFDKGDGAGTEIDPEIWQRIEEQTGKPVERLHHRAS
jgi:hypothetical protein